MTRMDRSKALPRTLYALVSFGAAVMTADSGLADSLTATFQQEQYANPQPDQPIFAVTWPGLIAANNEAHAKGFLHNGPAPGKNSSLVLNNAVLAIPGGRIVASINSGLYSGCHTGSLSQNSANSCVLLSCAGDDLQGRAGPDDRRGISMPRWRRHARQRGAHELRPGWERSPLLCGHRRRPCSIQQYG